MKHFAVIPVKHSSERAQNKNFRPFRDGKSLLDLKLEQLRRSEVYSEIFVSSDSPLARESAERHGARFLDRSARFCNNALSWHDVIVEVVSSVPVSESDAITWCHVTSPFFTDFRRAVQRFDALGGEFNGLFPVARLNRFLLDSQCKPVNYSWQNHPYSQDLSPYYFATMAFFIARKCDFLEARYVIPSRPYAMETSEREAIDIDTELDFEFARWLADRDSSSP